MLPMGGSGFAGDIRMPGLAGNIRRARVGMDRLDLGVARHPGRTGMDMQLPEMPAKGNMAVEIQLLVAKEQHLMGQERGVDFLELAMAEPPQINAANLRPDKRGNQTHLDRFIGRGASFPPGALVPTHAVNEGPVVLTEGSTLALWPQMTRRLDEMPKQPEEAAREGDRGRQIVTLRKACRP
jgi:hypothetical protein